MLIHGRLRRVLLCLVLTAGVRAQDKLKPLDPNKAKTSYSFPVHSGAPAWRFQVELDPTSAITGVSVFRQGDSKPFQTLPACQGGSMDLNEYDSERELLRHADLNSTASKMCSCCRTSLPIWGSRSGASTSGIRRSGTSVMNRRFLRWIRYHIPRIRRLPSTKIGRAGHSWTVRTVGMARNSSCSNRTERHTEATTLTAALRTIAAG